jgi:hypothetical protein
MGASSGAIASAATSRVAGAFGRRPPARLVRSVLEASENAAQ